MLNSGAAIRTSTDKVVWCNRGWYPIYYGFCPSEKAWKSALKRLGITSEPYPDTDGKCTFLEKNGKDLCAIVTIKDHSDPTEVIGILVHEAMHIWQAIKENIGEKDPGHEQEAYAMQAMTMELIDAYNKTRKNLFNGNAEH